LIVPFSFWHEDYHHHSHLLRDAPCSQMALISQTNSLHLPITHLASDLCRVHQKYNYRV
jgi:hypothetical protein